MFIVPKVDFLRNPDDLWRPVPPEGCEVPDSRYWRRRLLQGDVVLSTPPANKKQKKQVEDS